MAAQHQYPEGTGDQGEVNAIIAKRAGKKTSILLCYATYSSDLKKKKKKKIH